MSTQRVNPAVIYRQEAARLRSMAESETFMSVRQSLLEVAQQYDVLAAQADEINAHTFGRPLARHPQRPPR